ncbi:hypothetical protein [Curtobacterium sp. MCLR17_054]|uniref:hypothetical protein n=1 Tax=Curtobacterium sp. MCLR17_054 TaxID=2175632 RepID=UPI0024DFAA1D|nr:hypothetical protein [Curtobacterium sp. MCLR17_054]WIE70239.1 hypothetical protein DEJ08_018495 [Curtobacterium sp. MCLR17_054]
MTATTPTVGRPDVISDAVRSAVDELFLTDPGMPSSPSTRPPPTHPSESENGNSLPPNG